MIAVADPGKRDRLRKRERFDFGAIAETGRVRPGRSAPGTAGLEMCRSELIGFAGRMKRIAETDEAGDIAMLVEFVGNDARDAPAERLAANQQLLTALPALRHRPNHFTIF